MKCRCFFPRAVEARFSSSLPFKDHLPFARPQLYIYLILPSSYSTSIYSIAAVKYIRIMNCQQALYVINEFQLPGTQKRRLVRLQHPGPNCIPSISPSASQGNKAFSHVALTDRNRTIWLGLGPSPSSQSQSTVQLVALLIANCKKQG